MKLDGWQIPLFAIAIVFMAGALFMYPIDDASKMASWVQAIGSIGAILAAVWVLHQQQKQARIDDHAEKIWRSLRRCVKK